MQCRRHCFDHSETRFSGLIGGDWFKIQSIQYTVDCAYCDGYATITLDETRLQQDMKLKYTKINQRELVKYDTVVASGTI